MAQRLSTKQKIRSLLTVAFSGVSLFAGSRVYQGDEKFYDQCVMPLTRLLDPEVAHNLAVKALKWGLPYKQSFHDSDVLKQKIWGINFENPVGMAAGFDKHGEAIEGLHKMGFGFVEIGSVTPNPQPGNPKPRVFRLLDDKAVINRYGFNSDGHKVVYERLKSLRNDPNFQGIIGVNLGKNKTSLDSAEDYKIGLETFNDVADYFVINISSPNTAGLRNLQHKENLSSLLTQLNQTRDSLQPKVPILLKLAPDLSADERQDIAEVILREKSRVDGLILSNTTISRDNLSDPKKNEVGGLSGAPLTDLSTTMIADMFKRTRGKIPIIGVGGVFTGEDAYKKILAGASLIQIYTSYIYHGPPIVCKIKSELESLIVSNGYTSIEKAVGKGIGK